VPQYDGPITGFPGPTPKTQRPTPNAQRPTSNTWPRNAIDHFILERLERERLRPSPEADRVTLIRRLSLDLTGLPPTIP
jgi:hypothetical protein